MKNNKNRRDGRQKTRHESCAEKILRRVMHEANLGGKTPDEVYDATVKAVMMERSPEWGDIRSIERLLKRKERRYNAVAACKGPMKEEILYRLDMECGVLTWAADEMRAVVREEEAAKQ